MRITTIMSAAILGLSTAALAQVASTPAEQKPQANSGNDMAAMDNAVSGASANTATDAPTTNTTARSITLTPQTGDPTATSSAPRKP